MPLSKIISESVDLTDNFNFTGTLQQNGAGIGGANTPSFRATLSATQNISSSSWVKAQFNTELFDTDNMYDNSSNYRFTPTTAGKYFVYASLRHDWVSGWGHNNLTAIYKNGSEYIRNDFFGNGSGVQNYGVRACADIIDFNGTSDYVEVYGQSNSSGSGFFSGSSFFGAFKIIT